MDVNVDVDDDVDADDELTDLIFYKQECQVFFECKRIDLLHRYERKVVAEIVEVFDDFLLHY